MSDGWAATQWSLVPSTALTAVEALQRGAPGAGLALVAGRRLVVEVQAAGALQQVPPDRRHVPQLPGGAVQDRLGQNRIPGPDQGVRGQATVMHQGTDPKPAIRELIDPVQRQPGDVNDSLRPLDALTHQVDEVGTAGEELRPRLGSDRLEGGVHVRGADVGEGLHSATSSIAATMPLYAPHRHRLPLIRSRISAGVNSPPVAARCSVAALGAPSLCSASIPIAEQI